MPTVEAVLASRRGLVVAPAGCGKTELIVNSLMNCSGGPSLVLTHTTAGVAALRHRLKKAGVSPDSYRLNTIAGWAIALISMFPERSGYVNDPLSGPDYQQIQNAVGRLCVSGNITSELQATYGRLFVDEYQDCSLSQHTIVKGISAAIPTVVFGDPMQAVFGFGGDPLPDWQADVAPAFQSLGVLSIPWRWNNKQANDLGTWLLGVRASLASGQSIDLRSCPNRVIWHQLSGDYKANIAAQIAAQYQISRSYPQDTLLIIGDSRRVESRHDYASRVHGVGVVERVDFPDVIIFAQRMAAQQGAELLQSCIAFLITVMTNVYGDVLQRRVETILADRNRPAPTDQENAAIALIHGGGLADAQNFLLSMAADRNRRVYRMSAFNILVDALRTASVTADTCLTEVIARLREQRRHAGRSIPYKAVGSTLLLKGLEADHVLILDADNPSNGMSKEHLYVALTRGAKSVHVFSRNNILP